MESFAIDMERYYADLKQAFDQEGVSDHYNNDREHNATVLTLMLDESNIISMYCGELSILRKSFYDKVIDADPFNGKKVMQKMYDSLKKFFEKPNTHMQVILENKQDIDDFVQPEIVYDAIKNKKMDISYLSNALSTKKDLNHFTITDQMIVRVEQDKDEHTAICTFNESEYYGLFKKSFEKLLSFSEKLKLELKK